MATTIEHLDVLVVGAGLSGIGAGHHLQAQCRWASYAIFEARDAIGGTWDLFRYPGVRSDSDMYTLGYGFRPWKGRKAIADGESILQYIKDTAADEGIDEKIRFGHRVVAAAWSSDDTRWHVTAEKVHTGERFELTCGFLFSCSGYYRYDRGHMPTFPGLEGFGGQVVHPQAWPEDLDWAGKRVVIIGSGATAITLLPNLAKTAAHVTMLQRSPTYVSTVPETNPLARLVHRVVPDRYAGDVVRWMAALLGLGFFKLSRKRPAFVKRLLTKMVALQLPKGYDVATHFTPRYDPWDQRMCAVPNGDLFKAIKAGSASVVTDHIETFTETSIRLASGAELPADIVITATGLELLFIGGIDLSVDGEPVDLPSKLTYKGMMLEDVPNLAMAIGYTNASWTLKCELICDYVCRLLNRMHRDGLRQCAPVNHGGSVRPKPLLALSSGYVQRAADRFPKQGDDFPWQVHESYLADHKVMKRGAIDDGAMVFSNPTPREPALVPVAAAS